jgi:hypothetical protein
MCSKFHLYTCVIMSILKPLNVVELMSINDYNIGLRGLDFFGFLIDICWCVILKPPNVVEFLYGINYNVRFKEFDFFITSICKCWCVDPFNPFTVLNFFFTKLQCKV